MKPPDGRHPPPLGLTRREGIVSDRARNSTRAAISEAARSKVVHFESGRSPDFELRPGATRPIVRIHLLGPMRATTYLGDSILPRGRKARAILGWFCLSAGQRVARGRLASLLWDRVPHAQARASFRQALRELTTNLGPLADELLTGDRETVTFNTALCWIDALAVFATDPLPVSSSRGDLAALCTGELLEELDGTSVSFDQWLLGERTRFADQIRSLFEAEIERISTTTEDTAQLAAIARRLIAFEPTHEGASRVLMRALADSGERAQALREYNRCREALKTALDVEPSSETRALYDAIRAFPGRDDRNRKV